MKALRASLRTARRGARIADKPSVQLQAATLQVSGGADDADERTSSNAVFVTLTQLRFGVSTANMRAGVRFDALPLAKDAPVSLARLRFVSGGANSDPLTVRIRAQAHDDAPAFTSTDADLTSRSTTTAYVDWVMPAWSPDQDDADTISPDISSVMQEVVNRSGWAFGNAIVFLIDQQAGSTQRRPHTFESDPTKAARLSVNTSDETVSPPAPPGGSGGFSDGYDLFGLEGNAAFNPSAPTLKDGTAITDAMLTYYAATVAWAQNTSAKQRLANIYDTSNSYTAGRVGQPAFDALMRAFRLTGDLRLLDVLCGAFTVLGGRFTTAWSGHSVSAIDARDVEWATAGVLRPKVTGVAMTGNPWNPYPKMNQLSTSSWQKGTDISYQDAPKLWAQVAEFAWALYLNRLKASPGGRDYMALSETWADRVEKFVKAWSETSSAHWAVQNYRGMPSLPASGHSIPNTHSSSGRKRQVWGKWPFLMENEAHAGLNSISLTRYAGLLARAGAISAPNAVTDVAGVYESDVATREMARALFIGNPHPSYVTYVGPYGDAIAMTHNHPFTGVNRQIQRSTYVGYQVSTYIQLWLTGAYRAADQLSRERMLRLSRGLLYAFNGTTGEMYGNLLRMVNGQTLHSFTCADQGTTQGASENAQYARSSLLIFSDGHTGLDTISTNTQTSYGGGYALPNYGAIPSAQFLREALTAVGDLA
jgi:hypothetical protein